MSLIFAHPQVKIYLQLGHAGEGVEICSGVQISGAITVLQLGHAGEGVEMFIAVNISKDLMSLQLGHAGEGVEMPITSG